MVAGGGAGIHDVFASRFSTHVFLMLFFMVVLSCLQILCASLACLWLHVDARQDVALQGHGDGRMGCMVLHMGLVMDDACMVKDAC